MQAYLCKLGFARFCNIKYTAANSAEADISNPYVHLTNVSIQRRGEEYNEAHGNKWPLSCLLTWLQVHLYLKQLSAAVLVVLVCACVSCTGSKACYQLCAYPMHAHLNTGSSVHSASVLMTQGLLLLIMCRISPQ